MINGGPYVLAQHSADHSLAGPTNLYPGYTTRAKPRETLVLYANGFGAITPVPVSGAMTQNGTLPALPHVTIGGIDAVVKYAGVAGFPGLFQFNVVVPDAPDRDNQIAATYNGVTTLQVTLITVQNPAAATSACYYVAPDR